MERYSIVKINYKSKGESEMFYKCYWLQKQIKPFRIHSSWTCYILYFIGHICSEFGTFSFQLFESFVELYLTLVYRGPFVGLWIYGSFNLGSSPGCPHALSVVIVLLSCIWFRWRKLSFTNKEWLSTGSDIKEQGMIWWNVNAYILDQLICNSHG